MFIGIGLIFLADELGGNDEKIVFLGFRAFKKYFGVVFFFAKE